MSEIIIPAVYQHIKSGKNYHTYDIIINKTTDTWMIMYRDNIQSYVREREDFINKFKFIGE